jgi:hypothetical protein
MCGEAERGGPVVQGSGRIVQVYPSGTGTSRPEGTVTCSA